MKVSTDSVLLGAWAPVDKVTRALDIGCGSGLLALMIAQRTPDATMIEAIEIEPAAARQARENAARSRWATRIRVREGDVRSFTPSVRYDLIISNPPYYTAGPACADAARQLARQTGQLSHAALLERAADWLTPHGRFSLILPFQAGEQLTQQAAQLGWYLAQRTTVAALPDRTPHRLLLTFTRAPASLRNDQLTIRDAHQRYTPAFRALTAAFYLPAREENSPSD